MTKIILNMNRQTDDLKSLITNILLGVLFGAGLYLIFVPNSGYVGKKKKGLSVRDVRTYQTQVQNALSLQQKQVELQNYNTAPTLNGSSGNGKQDDYSDDIGPERNEGVLDTTSTQQIATSTTLESRINRFEHIKQKFEELAAVEKEKYLKNFKKEAKQLGYDVDVDEDFNITSIKSNRSPNN